MFHSLKSKKGWFAMKQTDTRGILGEDLKSYIGHPFKWGMTVLGKKRPLFFLGVFINLVCGVLIFAPIEVAARLVDEVFEQNIYDRITLYIVLIAALPCLRAVLSLIYRFFMEICSQDVIYRVRGGMYLHAQEMDMGFYSEIPAGEVMAKMTGDIDSIRHFFAWTFFFTCEQIFLFVAGAIYLLTINPLLASMILVLSPIVALVAMKMSRRVRPQWGVIRRNFEKLNTVVQQNIAGNRVVKAFSREEYETEKFEKENSEYRKSNERIADIWATYLPILEVIAGTIGVIVLLVGGLLVINGSMKLSQLVAFNSLAWVLNNPMKNLGNIINESQRYAASANKIVEFLATPTQIKSPEESIGCPQSGSVEFKNVSFAYSGKDAIRNISFTAKAGQTIGIVGETGSGKSTLVSLIPRFFDATDGEVLIDGKNVKDYDLQGLRNEIGMVMQEVFLFSDTVEGNVAYGDSDLPFEKVREYSRVSDADGFVTKMPDGYDTIIGERGVGLSGGQRQRISLARALAVNPKILILDDTTSALDMETERLIQNNLAERKGGQTTFIIAHRVSSVRNADLILVLENGEIKERGKHEELIKKGGIYCNYFLTQTGFDSVPENLGGEG